MEESSNLHTIRGQTRGSKMSEDTNKKGERNRYKDTRMKNGLQGF
jgi:hypothetical protein